MKKKQRKAPKVEQVQGYYLRPYLFFNLSGRDPKDEITVIYRRYKPLKKATK